jgi:serine/threonine protein phosphatase 1
VRLIRTLAISDIHGCYDEFNALLRKVEYNPNEDKLILLGDYVDRGFKSKDVLGQVKQLHEEWGVIVLRGNHDQMMLDAFNKEDEDGLWLNNGGLSTVESYVGLNYFECGFDYDTYLEAKELIVKHYSHHIEFLKSLKLYHEDENHIYVHAGLHPFYENWKEQPTENFIWIRDIFIRNSTCVDKKVVFGHTPTLNLSNNEVECIRDGIWFGEGKIGVDGGCCFGYQLNCVEINDEEVSYTAHNVLKGEK